MKLNGSWGWGHSSVAEPMPSTPWGLGSTLSSGNKGKRIINSGLSLTNSKLEAILSYKRPRLKEKKYPLHLNSKSRKVKTKESDDTNSWQRGWDGHAGHDWRGWSWFLLDRDTINIMKNETQRMGVEQELIQSVTNSLSFPETKKQNVQEKTNNKTKQRNCLVLNLRLSLHSIYCIPCPSV